MVKLLTELNEDLSFIKEAKEDGTKSYFVEGIFLQSNLKNRNGRIYPKEIVQKAVNDYRENFIVRKKSFGELGHPPNPTINLNLISHLITDIREDGNNFIGKAKILDTPNGKIAKALMDEDCLLGISSRGLGSLKESKEGKIVQSDFALATAGDLVSDPSAPEAWLTNIVENTEWIFDGMEWQKRELVQNIVEDFKQLNRRQREEQFIGMFKKLMGAL